MEPNEEKLDDYICSICLFVLYKPITTPCKHSFCLNCFEDCQELGIKTKNCPLCRSELPNFFLVELNVSLAEKIEKHFPKELEEKRNIIKEINSIEDGFIKLKLVYGNTHKLISNPSQSNSNPVLKNNHAWRAFVKMANGSKEDTIKYISKVVFKLHESFKNNVVTKTSFPFQVMKFGWGYFNIPIQIYFNQEVIDCEKYELNHLLNFDGEGETKTITLKLKLKYPEKEFEERRKNVEEEEKAAKERAEKQSLEKEEEERRKKEDEEKKEKEKEKEVKAKESESQKAKTVNSKTSSKSIGSTTVSSTKTNASSTSSTSSTRLSKIAKSNSTSQNKK